MTDFYYTHGGGYDAEARKLITELHQRSSRISSASRAELRERLDELEAKVRFLTLFSRGLMEVLVRSGATNTEEILALMRELDARHGQADNALDPGDLAEELGLPRPQLSAEERQERAAQVMRRSKKKKRM